MRTISEEYFCASWRFGQLFTFHQSLHLFLVSDENSDMNLCHILSYTKVFLNIDWLKIDSFLHLKSCFLFLNQPKCIVAPNLEILVKILAADPFLPFSSTQGSPCQDFDFGRVLQFWEKFSLKWLKPAPILIKIYLHPPKICM